MHASILFIQIIIICYDIIYMSIYGGLGIEPLTLGSLTSLVCNHCIVQNCVDCIPKFLFQNLTREPIDGVV